jgi:2,3-bisphosphoglycerate-independent phosphoglycerate mutase
MIWADWARYGKAVKFGETSCGTGTLGLIRHVDIMPLALAHAKRLNKFGA